MLTGLFQPIRKMMGFGPEAAAPDGNIQAVVNDQGFDLIFAGKRIVVFDEAPGGSNTEHILGVLNRTYTADGARLLRSSALPCCVGKHRIE